MTIYLHTGTITDANPSNAFSDVVKTLVGGTDVANWSFVENIPAGTGEGQTGSASYSCDVFKCAGTGTNANDASHDFYVGMLRQGVTVTNGLKIFTSEDYNAATKKFYNWPHYRAGDSVGTDANGYATYGSYSSSEELTAQKMIATTTGSNIAMITINTSGFSYWIYLTNNFLMVATKVGVTEKSVYIGLFDTLIDSATVSEHCPLVIAGNCLNGSYNIATSNYPGVINQTAGVITTLGKMALYAWTNNAGMLVSNATGAGDKWQSGRIHVSRGFIAHTSGSGNYAVTGFARGLLKKEILFFPTGGTVALGDTMTIGTETWTVIGTAFQPSISYAIVRSA